MSESEEPNGVHIIGTTVLRRLTRQVSVADRPDSFSWEVRINKLPGEPNAFSSPDGTIYIDRSLAQILGAHPGLWAAALSHEIAHILRRDWARRYIYEKFLQNESVPVISLGDFANSGSWTDSTGMAHMTSQFLQEMEIDADTYGLMLMARAGYHPDFMFSLHHLLRAQTDEKHPTDSSHPRWSPREEMLRNAYFAAGHEYDRLWPETYTSPGGNPPVLVSTGEPSTKKHHARDLEVRVTLRCTNLSGAVEVVLAVETAHNATRRTLSESRQLTGCTSNNTLITFPLAPDDLNAVSSAVADIYVIDDHGDLLSRSDEIKLPH